MVDNLWTPSFASQGDHRFPLTTSEQTPYKGVVTFRGFKDSYSSLTQDALRSINPAPAAPATPGAAAAAAVDRQVARNDISGSDPALQTVSTGLSGRSYAGSVQLYLPQSIIFSDRVNYNNNLDLGIMGTAAYNAIQQQGDLMDVGRQMLSSGLPSLESIQDALTQGLSSAGPAAQVAALRVSRRISSEVAGAISSGTGIAINPNKRSILESVPIRNFQFQFKLIPTSPAESNAIKSIISYFRYHMYPEAVSTGGIALEFPSKFEIGLSYDGRPVTTRILPCWLESVNTTYNGSSMAMHDDGGFQEVDITLGFIEERALTKTDIQNGY